MESLQSLIRRLELQPLPREGGWFRQYFLSPERDARGRPVRSVIHFVIAPGNFSALHRLATPEVWMFVDGAPVEHFQLLATGEVQRTVLGRETRAGERKSVEVPGGVWQGARTLGVWSQLDCAMTPAWLEEEFELGERDQLHREYPAHDTLISELTR